MADNDLSVNYEAVLADLTSRRDKLNAAIAGIEAILGLSAGPASSAPIAFGRPTLPTQVESDTFFQMSVPDAARKFLAMMKRPQTTQAIASALEQGGVLHSSKDFPNTVGSILSRVDRSGGNIVKLGRAQFGLAEWYPKRRKNGAKSDTGDDEVGDSASVIDIDDL